MPFSKLGLSAEILRAVADQGYLEPTPVQAQAIPPILAGQDIMAGAQTGTGKTAAFTLPMLEKLKACANTSLSPARHPVRALVLAPTRELAAQVAESVRTYGKHLALRSSVVFGGVDIDPQIKELHAGVEILVATPGRLLDHVRQRTVNLTQVQFLVLDEADRMLDMGFMPDIKRILSLLPKHRQNLLFSATFDDEIKRLARDLLNNPVQVQVARSNAMAELVTHRVYTVPERGKRELIGHLVNSRDMRQVLVFVTTRLGAARLARQLLRDGIEAAEIHSDKSQLQRMQALEDFKQGKVRVLVATDIAARGLDIEELPHVINYELPNNPEDYVHRIGRTGRAGATGEAISLVSPEENEQLKAVERFLKMKLPAEAVAGFDREERWQDERHPRERRGHERPARGPARAPARGTARGPAQPEHRGAREHPRSRAHQDALFSQPYVPSESARAPDAAAERPHHGRQKKPVAALFLPPTKEKG
ncbi:MAG: DEAD/DEAH box helicase [Betaproteobacteria bacterium]|nr:DEAD/DEAH box helicase [Betaproteobacteria bacterium]